MATETAKPSTLHMNGLTMFECQKEPGHEGKCEWRSDPEYIAETVIQWKSFNGH